MSRDRWTPADIPDQTGRVAIVTGASSGIGRETARVLAAHGASVVLACRNIEKARLAAARIESQHPGARTEVLKLDLASLTSVREAAVLVRSRYARVDLLVNNAGVMEPPFQRTVDGFELTFGTNHLGPFAFTGQILDRLAGTPGSRIVTVSSEGHYSGVMHFDDLQFETRYDPEQAYYQSKLANVLFSYELNRRLDAAGAPTAALACHPGIVFTDLFRTRSKLQQALLSPRYRLLNFWFVQSVQMGALPTLRAAVDPSAKGGEFYGPPGRFYTGYPIRAESSARSYVTADQARLWEVSERLTGVSYAISGAPNLL